MAEEEEFESEEDDFPYDSPQEDDEPSENLKWIFGSSYGERIGMYIPLTWLTWSLDYIIWGMNPFGYHLTNIIIHSVSAAVFYFLALTTPKQRVALVSKVLILILVYQHRPNPQIRYP